ncbi:MAG: hypothetical protein QJQ54_00240 [Mollicutes bacterium]|nr:MAG: hypothetical protein QJQ54_00240 [Mollicutes bacterium]
MAKQRLIEAVVIIEEIEELKKKIKQKTKKAKQNNTKNKESLTPNIKYDRKELKV